MSLITMILDLYILRNTRVDKPIFPQFLLKKKQQKQNKKKTAINVKQIIFY